MTLSPLTAGRTGPTPPRPNPPATTRPTPLSPDQAIPTCPTSTGPIGPIDPNQATPIGPGTPDQAAPTRPIAPPDDSPGPIGPRISRTGPRSGRLALTGSTSAELVVAARSGNVAAAGELYRRTVSRARAAARCFCTETDADDAVADGLTRALTRLDQLKDPEAVEAWMIRCAVRAAIDLSRQRRRHCPTGSVDALSESALPSIESAAERALIALDHGMVAMVLRDLPADARLLLELRYHAELSVRRIAEALRRPDGTVRRQCAEARTMAAQHYLGRQLRAPAGACAGITDLMCRGAYRRLSDRSRGRIDQHLRLCRGCRDRRRELGDLLGEMGRRPAGEAPTPAGHSDPRRAAG